MDGCLAVVCTVLIWALLAWLGIGDVWNVVERASWLVIILGLPIAIWQLALLMVEQRRLGRELTERADVRVFFEHGSDLTKEPPVLSTSAVIQPTWSGNQSLSDLFELRILARNVGVRTGREPFLNISWPPGINGPVGEMTLGTQHVSIVKDRAGHLRHIVSQQFLHPGVLWVIVAQVQFPRGMREVPITVSVNVSDKRPTVSELSLTLLPS